MTNAEAINIIEIAQAEVEWEYPISYAAAFEKAIEALRAQKNTYVIPCKVGDTAFGIKRVGRGFKIVSGRISEIFFFDRMEMGVVMKGICRGKWNENIFATKEEAEAEVARRIGGAGHA